MESDLVASVIGWLRAPNLSDVGSVASLLGLALTVWVAWAVRRLRTSYLFSARVPALAKRLRQHAAKLSDYLNDADAFKAKIEEELAAAEVTAGSLYRKLDGHSRKVMKSLKSSIRRSTKGALSEDQLRVVYLEMVKMNEQLKDLQADLKWER